MEAVLLRHINYVYKVLSQTVPDSLKTDELREMEDYLGEMIRRTDSSLLEEWERLKNPEFEAKEAVEEKAFHADEAANDVTVDRKKFLALSRARIFSVLSLFRNCRFGEALDLLAEDLEEGKPLVDLEGVPWTETRLAEIFADYTAEHGKFRLDAEARALSHTVSKWSAETLEILQVLVDDADDNDFGVMFRISLSESRAAGAPLVSLASIGPIG